MCTIEHGKLYDARFAQTKIASSIFLMRADDDEVKRMHIHTHMHVPMTNENAEECSSQASRQIRCARTAYTDHEKKFGLGFIIIMYCLCSYLILSDAELRTCAVQSLQPLDSRRVQCVCVCVRLCIWLNPFISHSRHLNSIRVWLCGATAAVAAI